MKVGALCIKKEGAHFDTPSFRKRGSVAAIAVVATLFVGLMWPYAIQQSKTQIADWLANVQLMLDTSVVLTVEVAL